MDCGAGMEELMSNEKRYQFYNEYAKVKGFSVRKEDVKYLPRTSTRFRRLYTCFNDSEIQPLELRDPRCLTYSSRLSIEYPPVVCFCCVIKFVKTISFLHFDMIVSPQRLHPLHLEYAPKKRQNMLCKVVHIVVMNDKKSAIFLLNLPLL
jgi:hypothetical protein